MANPWRMSSEPRRWWHVDAPQDFFYEGDPAWACYVEPDTERQWWFRDSDDEMFFEDEAKCRHTECDTGCCIDTKDYEGDTGSCMDTKDCDTSVADVRVKDREPWAEWRAWREVETRTVDKEWPSEASEQAWWHDTQNGASSASARLCQPPFPFRPWLVDMLRLWCQELVHRCLVTRTAANDVDSLAPELLMKLVCKSLQHKNLVSLVLGLESNVGGQLQGFWFQLCIYMAGSAKQSLPGFRTPFIQLDPRNMDAEILIQFICLALYFAPESFLWLRDKHQPCLQLIVDLGRKRASTNITNHQPFIAEIDVTARDQFLKIPPVVQRRIVVAARSIGPANLSSFVMFRIKNLSHEWDLILSEARSHDRSSATGSRDCNLNSEQHTSAISSSKANLADDAKPKAESWLHACADSRNLGASSSRPSGVSSKPQVSLTHSAPEHRQWREPANWAYRNDSSASIGTSWHQSESDDLVRNKGSSPKESSTSDGWCAEPWIQRACGTIAADSWSTRKWDWVDGCESRAWSDDRCWERSTSQDSVDGTFRAGWWTGNPHGLPEVDESSTADSHGQKDCHTISSIHSNVPSQHSQVAEVAEASRDVAAALQCLERAVLRMDRALKGPAIR